MRQSVKKGIKDTPAAPLKIKSVLRNCSISLVLITASLLLTQSRYYYKNLLLFFGLYLAFAILLFSCSVFWQLPKAFRTKLPLLSFLVRSFVSIILIFVSSALLSNLAIHDVETSITYAVLISIFQFFVTLPLSWYWYNRQWKDDQTIRSLKKELGHSTASFDFLRSQINPHFLFNALNTIYGTALQEGAERTSQGIERLADMMRFMLQENMQEQIPLFRELNYIRHYIELQKLRIAPNETVRIQMSIIAETDHYHIAPMLLVPFVENACKHGISFREPSHISISVDVVKGWLHLRVINSTHQQKHNNPEEKNTGIGLSNVKQRLALLYPRSHELSIRENEREFDVNLKVQLD